MGGRITDPEEQQLAAYGGASGEHHERGGVEETTCGVQRGECQNEEKGWWKAVAMKEESCNIMYINCGIIDIVEGGGGLIFILSVAIPHPPIYSTNKF